jgi:GNAT superfamily N-acetyltransferase
MKTLRPKPSVRVLKLLKEGFNTIPVNVLSPLWLQQELYLRAKMFRREFRYDFSQWSPNGDEQPDAHGFLFNDDTGAFGRGAIIGGTVFRWVEFRDATARWAMDWVWIAPAARRKGVLSRLWPAFIQRFEEFRLTPPVSSDMMAFAAKHDHPSSK